MNECFPLVILEAMEYKLPVISTNEGGIPDIVKDGENGLICEKQNPYSLADCIAKLLDDEELRVKWEMPVMRNSVVNLLYNDLRAGCWIYYLKIFLKRKKKTNF